MRASSLRNARRPKAAGRYGVALDIGTSKVEGFLVDLATGERRSFHTVSNDQRLFGPDVISRLKFALTEPGAARKLQRSVLATVDNLLFQLVRKASVDPALIERVVCVGNSAMHHLFLGLSTARLARSPFTPMYLKKIYKTVSAKLGIRAAPFARIEFMPNLGGFVGSDALAALVAMGLHTSRALVAVCDIGTNGEIIVGDRKRIYVASTSAGPAFEGWHISCGMPAFKGVVDSVALKKKSLRLSVIGGLKPRGLCGTAVIDVVAHLLTMGIVEKNGRMACGSYTIKPGIVFTQSDVREVQLAKAAVAAALSILRARFPGRTLSRFVLAGTFGNRISAVNARRIGLVPYGVSARRVVAAPHAACDGAGRILASSAAEKAALAVCRRIVHIELHREPSFQDEFVRAMSFDTTPVASTGRGATRSLK